MPKEPRLHSQPMPLQHVLAGSNHLALGFCCVVFEILLRAFHKEGVVNGADYLNGMLHQKNARQAKYFRSTALHPKIPQG